MICPNKKCKKEIQNDSKLCPYCGYNLSNFFKNSNELFLYAKNMIENREYFSARLALREASRLGNSYAMVLYGTMYEKELGVSYSDKHICYCYENAAKLKNQDAIYFLAKAYMNGTYGKEKDNFKAYGYYQELDLDRRTSEFKLLEDWVEEENIGEAIESTALGDFVLEKGNIYESPFEEPIVHDNSEDVIFEERNNLKKCLGELEESIESWQSRLKEMDSIVDFYSDEWLDWINNQDYNKTIESRIEDLKKKRRTPYIGRMKLKYESGYESDIYVGREVITNDKGDIIVHSWFSDIGNKIYNDVDTSYIVNHKTVNLLMKRMIDIQNAVFINATEVFNIKYGDKFLTIKSDDYLKKILSQKKNNNQLTDIIATIQYNQNQIITFDSKKNMVMQGCAGSGKTMVLFHRIKYLIGNKNLSNDDICILTPSITFNQHVEPLLKDLNISNSKIFSMKDFYDYIIESYVSEKYQSKKWRGIYTGGYSTESHENQTSKKFISGKYNSYDCKVTYKEDDLLPKDVVDYFYSFDFFDSIMALETVKINPLTPARIKTKSFDGKARILETLFDAKTLMLFPKYDRIPGIIHKCELYAITLLFFKRCGNKKYSAENQLNQELNRLLDFNMYFIDEAQDLSIPEYRLLKALGTNQKKKVFNLFGDVNQTISNTGIKEWNSVSNCIGDLTKFEYNKNYRNTTQIVDYVMDECDVQMEKVGMEGSRVKQIKTIEIEDFILKNLKFRSVVIVSKKLINKFKEMFSSHQNLFKTVRDVKGIEYDSVCVVLEELTINEKYIALTRTLSNLYIVK